MNKMKFQKIFEEILQIEIKTLKDILNNLSNYSSIENTIDLILDSNTNNIFTFGIGKSGLLAKKFSTTLNCIDITSFYIHGTDALHGDMGLVKNGDVGIMISHSGETKEILKLTKCLRDRKQIKIVSITSNVDSSLGKLSDIVIDTLVKKEALPIDFIPSASVLATLTICDLIIGGIIKTKTISKDVYLLNHPKS